MAQLPPEQDESLIDMATRYGQGVMRKHPIITRGLASAATDPLDLMQFLAMHGVDPGIVAPNQIETPDQVAARQELASSIPNAGELAQKYLAKAGVRESETLPEQIGELGVSMLGPAAIAKAPKAFSWGAKILGKASPAKATALTTDAFHGTGYDFPAFVNNAGKFVRGWKDGPSALDQALGTHFAKDPNVSNTFADDIEGGRVIPVKIPNEKTFLEVRQDLLPSITDRSTPKNPSNVYSDQRAIQKMIAAEGYKLRPDLLARYLVQARKMPEDVAASIAKKLAKGKSVALKEFDIEIGTGRYKTTLSSPDTGVSDKFPWKINKEKKVNLERFLDIYGGNPYNSKDRADLVDTTRKSWQDKGYTGLKYLNTSPRETEFAEDPTSYIVFDPKHIRSRFAKFNPADVESSDLLKARGGAVRMGKGGLLKAGAEELAELAQKYLPKVGKSGLPIDEASRMKRAEEMGMTTPAYHGSTRNITSFSNTYSDPENYYGPHHYFTSSVDDVNANYAGEGPDLTDRIQRETDHIQRKTDRIQREIESDQDGYGLQQYIEDQGLDYSDVEDAGALDLYAKQMAKEQLGIENLGTVYPVKLRMKNPVVVGGPKETFFDYNINVDDAGDVVDESGKAIDLINKTKEAFDEWQVDEYSAQDALEKISERISDGGITASEFDNAIRSSVNDLYDEYSENMASPGALISDIFQKMGHDSIDMDASVFSNRRGFGEVKLPGMVGTENARHYIVFDPKNIRSRFAEFDPAASESSDLLKATGGAVRKATGGLSRVNEAGNYTKPGMRKRLFNQIKARAVQGTKAGQWSARKAQLLAKKYKEQGGGYKD